MSPFKSIYQSLIASAAPRPGRRRRSRATLPGLETALRSKHAGPATMAQSWRSDRRPLSIESAVGCHGPSRPLPFRVGLPSGIVPSTTRLRRLPQPNDRNVQLLW